jgi:colanic acid/amylovoran biosynthesis glycosyltransferase
MVQSSPIAKPTVLIYRDTLLPQSETFIPAQVGALDRFAAVFVGTRRESGFAADSIEILGGDRLSPLWKTLFKTMGQIPPGWLDRLRRHQPRLIHAHFGPDGTFALPLARALRIPLVVTFHGYDATLAGLSESALARSPLALTRQFVQQRGTFYREQYLRRRSRLFAEADCIIAVSDFIADRLRQAGCPDSKLRVHYIGIDRSRFVARTCQPQSLGSIPEPPIVLFVGRLVEKKGASDLIQACAQLDPQPKLVIIGDGPLRSDLEAETQTLKVNAEFLGYQPPESVQHWLTQAQIFCVPSRTARSGDAEGLGMVFAEAQAMGIPVVSCRSGGVPEVVQDHHTGLLVPEADPTALAAALGRILRDQSLRESLSAAGPHWIADRFDLQTNTAKLEAIYDEILAQHRSKQHHQP